MVERTALVQAINDARAMIALLTAAALLSIPFATASRARGAARSGPP